jgi:hypothetical protein
MRRVILFGDDIGHGDLGIYGHPTSRTPNLDKMASEGAKLTTYESGANVCSPSRASLMTGRYYPRTGVYPGVLSPNSVGGLPLNETTAAAELKKVGYVTGMVGKWHLGVGEYLPTNHGFDYYFGEFKMTRQDAHAVSRVVLVVLSHTTLDTVVLWLASVCGPCSTHSLTHSLPAALRTHLTGAPMTQNECTSNIKYPGASEYKAAEAWAALSEAVKAVAATSPPPMPTCKTPYVVEGVGLSSGGITHREATTADECCAVCASLGNVTCAAWTFHSTTKGCVVSDTIQPHVSAGTKDATAGSWSKPPPPSPVPPPAPHGGSGFGPCPILNGSDGAVTVQVG